MHTKLEVDGELPVIANTTGAGNFATTDYTMKASGTGVTTGDIVSESADIVWRKASQSN